MRREIRQKYGVTLASHGEARGEEKSVGEEGWQEKLWRNSGRNV